MVLFVVNALWLNALPLNWHNVTVDRNVDAVYCMYCDSYRHFWIGSDHGLYRYDGFNAYLAIDDDLFRSQVYSIVEQAGVLYIGTNNGLLGIDMLTGNYRALAVGTPSEIRSMLIVDDVLWIGTLGGLYFYDIASGVLSKSDARLPHSAIYSIIRDVRGITYLGTYNGLCRYNAGTRSFDTVELSTGTRSNVFVNTIVDDPANNCLWLGYEGGLLRYSPRTDESATISRFDGNSVKALMLADDGSLVVGTDDGLYIKRGDNVELYRHDSRQKKSISHNVVWSLYSCEQGSIYAGTGMGMAIAETRPVLRQVALDELTGSGEGNCLYRMLRDNSGNLWMGGTNGIIRQAADGSGTTWYRPGDPQHPLSHNRVRDIYQSHRGEIWVATDGGINRYDSAIGQFRNYRISDSTGQYNANWVYSILEDSSKMVTGSYLGGILVVDRARLPEAGGSCVADVAINASNGLNNNLINQMVADPEGNMWVLLFRDSTLTRIDAHTHAISRTDIRKVSGAYPSAVVCDPDGLIWCGFANGVAVVGCDGQVWHVVRFPIGDDCNFLTMSVVDDEVWASTSSGMWSISRSDYSARMLPLPMKNYSCIYYDALTDRVLLGDVDGYAEVHRDMLNAIGEADSIAVERLLFDGVPARLGRDAIEVPDGVRRIDIELTAFTYSRQNPYRFAYRIGHQGNWVLVDDESNVISLSGLSHGSYTIDILLVGAEQQPTTISLKVLPPWYLSTFAIVVYLLVLVLGIVALVAYFHRRNIEKLNRLEKERTLESVDNKLKFLSNMSHELKTPLSMIMGPVSQLRERIADGTVRHTLDVVYDNALKLNTLIHRTIEIDRLEANKDNMLIYSRLNAVEFCRCILESYRDSRSDKRFSFSASLPEIIIEADAVKLESILDNLLSNACKYSDEGASVACELSCSGNMLTIAVSDDGMGIPENEHNLIFERMYRSARTAGLREGTGIGLYLIKHYIEMHGGTIAVTSRENEGTTFVVSMPVVCGQSATEPGSPADSTRIGSAVNRRRILIVDDNIAIASFIKELLSAEYLCEVAQNGKSGLAMVASFAPDLIIADEMMPIMTGIEMCRRIKDNPTTAAIPIIMLTAKNDSETETHSALSGIDVFIGKPFDAPLLVARVGQMLKAKDDMRRSARIETITTPQPIEAESTAEKQLAAISQAIEAHISDPDLNVNSLSETTGIHSKQMYRLVKKYVGVTPVEYIKQMRLRKAAMLLEQQKFTVSEIMYMVGFSSSSYFSKCFAAQYGCTPSQYAQNGGADE